MNFRTQIASWLVLMILLFFLYSCSQATTGIHKTYSFYKINTPGNIPVDENGKPIGKIHDTTRIVYFETAKGVRPQLLEFIVNGVRFKPILKKIAANREEAGTLLETNKLLIVKARPNKQLWKVEPADKIGEDVPTNLKHDMVYLLVEYEGRTAMRIIKKPNELVPELNY